MDGEEFPAVPLYAFEQTEGGIAFYTTDPQFEIALPQRQEVRMVEISGQTSRLLPFEVEEKAIWKAAQENRALEQNCRELNGKISELNDFHTRSEYLQHHRLKAAVRALLGRLWNQ